MASRASRPRLGGLRLTQQAMVATIDEPRPRQGLRSITSTKRSKKTFRPGTRSGATRPRLGAANPFHK
eukprot:1408397-Amphidinium_carterae.1